MILLWWLLKIAGFKVGCLEGGAQEESDIGTSIYYYFLGVNFFEDMFNKVYIK